MSEEYNSNEGYTNNESSGTSGNTGYNNGASGQTGNGSYNYSQSGSGYQSGSNDGWQHTNSNMNGNMNGGNGGRKNNGGGKVALAVILAAAVGVAGGYGVSRVTGTGAQTNETAEAGGSEESGEAKAAEEAASSETTQSQEEQESAATGGSLQTTETTVAASDVTEVVENVMPSVVSVYNNYTETMQNYFGQTYAQEATSTGTGFIIAEDTDNNELLVATNNHVVEDADSLEVQFIDETTAEANIKGTDSNNDLAVIAIKLDDLDEDTRAQIKVATLGDSSKLKIGESVVAIGNALGYGQSVTTGVVSALDREISSSSISGTFIQTDAAINPGNSGGPLVDLGGNVIGINSSKIGGTTVDGMGFAIPTSTAVPIIQDLMNQKTKATVAEEDRGYLGISGVSVTSQVASAYGMPEGVYVAQIIEGGGAADSDLQKGDVITGIEGTTVSDMEALQKQLTYYEAGEEITLTVQRQDGSGEYAEKEITLTLGDKSAINDYESSQEEAEKSSRHSYGYNNGGSGKEDSQDSSQEESDESEDSGRADNDNDSDSENSKESEESEEDSPYYSFPFGDIFGNR